MTPVGLSFTDTGRLVTAGNRLLRLISGPRAVFTRSLFDSGLIGSLVDAGLLIESEIVEVAGLDADLVVEHRQIPHLTYPHEWCDEMLRDAALLQLDLNLSLHRAGLVSGDAHPLNVVFDATRPVFVDLGSIEERAELETETEWHRMHQFDRSFRNPLRLMSAGHGRIARALLQDYERGIESSDVAALRARRLLPRIRSRLRRQLRTDDYVSSLQSARNELVALRFDASSDVDWPALTTEGLPQHLAQLRPGSVLVAAGGTSRGQAAVRAAIESGARVVAIETNEPQARALHQWARAQGSPLTVAITDLVSPSHDHSNRWFALLATRLRCDLVIAPGIVSPLIVDGCVDPAVVAERLAMVADAAVVFDSSDSTVVFALTTSLETEGFAVDALDSLWYIAHRTAS
ncbi:MAG: hypothetical protein GY925_29890 [Actinomycetia bacterium]|nr:hypothetical protein [Actinomycetes bacterium]